MFCGAACNEQVVFGIILGKQSSRALATIMCTKLLLVRCYSIVFRVVQIIVNTFQLGWPVFLCPPTWCLYITIAIFASYYNTENMFENHSCYAREQPNYTL